MAKDSFEKSSTAIKLADFEKRIPGAFVYKQDGSLKDDNGKVLKQIDTWYVDEFYFDSDDGIVFEMQADGNGKSVFTISKDKLAQIIKMCEKRDKELSTITKEEKQAAKEEIKKLLKSRRVR